MSRFELFTGLFPCNLPNEYITPANFSAMGLQHDRPTGRQGLGAIPEIFHYGIINNQLAIEPDPCPVANLANFHLIPLTKWPVGQQERITTKRAGCVIKKPA